MTLLVLLLTIVPTGEPNEEAFLRYRQSLTSGKVTFTASGEAPVLGIPRQKWKQTIWYDSEHFRCDVTLLDGDKTGRRIYCENCDPEGCYLYFDERDIGTNHFPVMLQDMGVAGVGQRVGQGLKFDVRLLGTAVSSFHHLHALKLSDVLCRADRSDPEWRRTKWQNKDALTMSYTFKHGPQEHLTFLPEMGNALVRRELTVTRRGTEAKTREVLDVEPKQFGRARIWFPAKMEYEHTENGRLKEKILLEVTEATFNESIPANTFRLIGMALPPGTDIIFTGQNAMASGPYTWDGKEMVKKK